MAFRSSKALKAGKQDRLSALPDSILCHILSCLQTKHAVATSVLSTRWKHLYRSVPVIDLEDTSDETEIEEETGTEMAYNGFKRFCNRVLLLRNGVDIVKFRLNCQRDYVGSLIYDWVCAALCRNVQEIDLCAKWHGDSQKQRVPIPTEIFTHKRLLTLKLVAFAISVPHSVCLPNLGTLDLRDVTFPGGVGDLLKLLAGCKSIQDFSLEGMIDSSEQLVEMDQWAVCNLFTPSLRRLTLIYTDLHPVIDIPNLEYLSIISESVYGFKLKNLASLVRASFRLEMLESLSEIVDGLCSVKFLFLGRTCGKFSVGDFSLFSKLQHLEAVELCPGLDFDCGCDLGVVPQLLNNTPYLQTLILDLRLISAKILRRYEFSLLDTKKPLCLAQKLRKVEIKNSSALEAEFKMIEYLMQHGEVLESVNFKYSAGRNPAEVWTYSKWRRLLMFPRCSKICKVVLPKGNSA